MHDAHELMVAHGSEHRCNGPLQVGQDPQTRAGHTARFDPFRERPFLKTRLFTSYLWGVNFKPFGTGEFGSQKKFVLDALMDTESPHSSVFQKCGERISSTLGYFLEQTNRDRPRPVELASRQRPKGVSCEGAGGLSRCPFPPTGA